MVRAPYSVRIAAGLIVTALEETQKLPTLVVTLPMTALSEALQFGMRLQQGVAGLAIKGDLALELMFDRPSEEPSWARFDEDDDPELSLVPAEQPGADALDDQPEPPGGEPAAAAATQVSDPEPESEPADDDAPAARAAGGRFALYSSAPDAVVQATTNGAASEASDGPVPEIVEYIEYNRLTLAQLRAKLRSVDADDLATLLEYERATKGRAPFVTMIENRITAQQKRHSTT
ncbi:lipid droplet-associated protein [Gordonia amarae]|uniref:Lipid droplet-associated protein n=2 Tax=Gordonia amarae TaxID=36821 RepID=G7GNR8_9ACTN|nr:lipid droplet-associated protein [Gordonia amarae]MCS3878171.1 hypothetical protein [Gordonia amarae]QHN16839.1 lipid droplet-associated protein [Gordonia amarae]QHN21364.1 lipid droplet-associated protein [Gordonia amarae]QHN30217.1 lipid droplet-associated protein [Gordonia amarae]QHN38991.1 lipid droplet-associated protein [Gordonia amarae]